jgi:hypothetical protein
MDTDDPNDESPDDVALRQLRALRRRQQLNLLNERKVKRRAREAGLTELADAVDGKRYYALLDRYLAANRSSGNPDE